MATVGTHAINPTLYTKLPYDPGGFHANRAHRHGAGRDCGASRAARTTVAELVALARRTPGKLNYGSAGVGTPGHLTGEMSRALRASLPTCSLRGSAPAVTDLIGGQLQIMFDPLQSVFSNIQGGRLRALAVSSKERPSSRECSHDFRIGFGGFQTTAWWGIFAPARLPAPLTETLIAAARKIVQDAPFRNTLEPLGVVPTLISGQAFAEFQAGEMIKWGRRFATPARRPNNIQ